jgi:hypothetical protein
MDETNNNKDSSKSEDHQSDSSLSRQSEGCDYFFNDDGFVVFTAKYLLDRGYCCGNGCMNCPYDYKAVPEPKRSRLLAERKKNESNGNGS